MKKQHLCLVVLLLLPLPVLGADFDQQFKQGDKVTISPDKAYFLARSISSEGDEIAPVLVRVLNEEEINKAVAIAKVDPQNWDEKADSNVVALFAENPYAVRDKERVMLVAAPPGTYILLGVAINGWQMVHRGAMPVILCMGTVQFDAKAGTITDLGTLLTALDNRPTTIPELKDRVHGKSLDMRTPLLVAIRPSQTSTPVPDTLMGLPVVSADYRAMRGFPNYLGVSVSRLVPLPGVLDYDKDGNVIDLKAKP